ncbi:peptide/nickel transport system ATP-binding protein [Tissierella praeacuta DSM 18095]|uniref:Peptide/nickel transport system ATP-binding protein n=1 Tax=Tissierella praeacuta DSM 18095 TaxID=1123404 RepID=A0A1M4YHE5_9FIRM|nr:ATP-binding cassette domain-containing protein [Tissierella praeacuta]TCU66416.1 peptide/nickel transport system ATP-binding protein [Tissierella praeacuta]SHF05215.1 peptide/nickel transport system ATP-binding protein [Tissierella praeacuta DSM 18095]SUP02013.1 Glutathione import ATP-binding protein GsiA [Tissierella praeacuta]
MILEAKNIYFKYPSSKEWILEDISLTVNSSEVVGLVGTSGRGKSTLGKIMAGQEKQSSGEILLDGKILPLNTYSPVQLIFQHPELAVNPKWKLGKTLEEAGGYDELLRTEMGIRDEFLNRWPNELSGGELQRICVMRALKPQTKFIIADEISTMLDVITQSQIWNIILDFAKKNNIGILAITHNENLAKAICSRIVYL